MSFSHWSNYLGWGFLVIMKGLETVFPQYKSSLEDVILVLAGLGYHLNLEK